jgi:hypothetical protein
MEKIHRRGSRAWAVSTLDCDTLYINNNCFFLASCVCHRESRCPPLAPGRNRSKRSAMTLGFSHQSGTQVRPAAAGTVSKKEFERIVDLRCGRKKEENGPGRRTSRPSPIQARARVQSGRVLLSEERRTTPWITTNCSCNFVRVALHNNVLKREAVLHSRYHKLRGPTRFFN